MHTLDVILADQDGRTIASVQAQFQVPPEVLAALQPNEEIAVNIPLGLQGLVVPRDGIYAFDLLIDNTHAASIPFQGVIQALPLPPPAQALQ